MGKKWRRSKLSLTTGFILSAVMASQGYAHRSVELISVNGTSICENLKESENVTLVANDNSTVTLYKGDPVSWEKTCSGCHENIVEDVRMSHHGAVGLHDMGWLDSRETYGDDTGTKDFVTNKVLKMRYFRSKSHYGGW